MTASEAKPARAARASEYDPIRMAFIRSDPATAATGLPGVRAFTLVSGAGRIALGAAMMLAPRPALAGLGFSDVTDSTVAVARIAGGRDVALGVATLLARDDRERLRAASLANAAVDAGDASAFAAALASDEGGAARAGARGLALALPAALAGAWVARRLS